MGIPRHFGAVQLPWSPSWRDFKRAHFSPAGGPDHANRTSGGSKYAPDLLSPLYLPSIAVSLSGGNPEKIGLSLLAATTSVFLVLLIAVRYGEPLSRIVAHESDEIVLLTIFGAVLVVAGVSQRMHVSSAIGAFLVGIAVSGPMAKQTYRLLSPLRDLFAAIFFFFFGLQIDPAASSSPLVPAVSLGAVTVATKMLTGYWAIRPNGCNTKDRLRAGAALVAHGEFSVVIAGLGVGLEPRLGPLSAAYVLFLAILAPILYRLLR